MSCDNETKSVKIYSIEGDEGPKGDQGDQGQQGIQGDAGPAGPAGPEGPAGAGIPIYTTIGAFPTDGSVSVAMFAPTHGLRFGSNPVGQRFLYFVGGGYAAPYQIEVYDDASQTTYTGVTYPTGWTLT